MKRAIAMIIAAALMLGAAMADDTGWVICQPGDYVNVRLNPSMKAGVIGRLEMGDEVHLDGQQRNGFLHCVRIGLEVSEAWVYAGYIVYGEPKTGEWTGTIHSDGRVAARKCIGGKRRCWLRDEQAVKVYAHGGGWAVTNKGFVQTEYLQIGGGAR
jgi:hypothetical protein